MWPFKKRIWKEISKVFLRSEYDVGPYMQMAKFKVWAVTYEDILSGRTKIEERWELI
jgi:hypothetical protein